MLFDAAINLRTVVAAWLIEDARPVLDAAAFRIIGAEIEPAQAGKADRRGAHGARLEGDVEIAFGKALGAELGRTRTQHQHLGMRRRVTVRLDAIAGGGEDPPLAVDQHGPHRHLAAGGSRFRFGEGS